MKNYQFLNSLLLRSPFYSYREYSMAKAAEVLNDPYFQTALYLASPLLYRQLASKHFDFNTLAAKEQLSILKYLNRMSFRPTPFGSFSSFSLAAWGNNEGDVQVGQNAQLHLGIDRQVALILAEGLVGKGFEKYTYTCNPALYRSGKEFRFVKTSYTRDKKNVLFALESYEYNALTVALMDFCTDSYRPAMEIMALMVQTTGCDLETAKDYLKFLVGAQILIADTAINMIGEDYLQRLLSHPAITSTAFRQALDEIFKKLPLIPFPGVNPLIKLSDEIKGLLPGLEKENQFFYAGLERKIVTGGLALKYQQQVMEGLNALNILAQPAQPPMLTQFIRDFKNRYDLRKVSLLEAIDPETGIGYGPNAAIPPELLHRVNFKEVREDNIQLEWTAVHRLLLKRWNDNGCHTGPIRLTDGDLDAIQTGADLSSPPTLAVLFRVIDEVVFLETVGGVSATALIGRFTAWNRDVHNLSRQLAALEQSANPGVIFADIGQLSDAHADNINRRAHSYDYEITVNTVSTLPAGHQIALADLWISVIGDKLILESARLQKVIVPRLSSAYNYSRNHLAAFRLLCDLQYQGLQGSYSFGLEQYFPGMAYYPGVTYKQTILSPASWHLSHLDLEELKSPNEEKAFGRFKLLQKKLGLPPVVALSRFDQQLVFNTGRREEVLFLLDCMKGMDHAVLQEYFLPGQSIVVNRDGKPLVNQFIAFLYKNDMVYPGYQIVDTVAKSKVKQEYILGSKWLYLKIYCNPAIANQLLIKKLFPLLRQLDRDTLRSWFFIRYRDSGYHIRLRLEVSELLIGRVLVKLKKRLADSVHYHLVREYQADTYRREMERYGPDMIGLVEGFFYGSSELILDYIKISGFKSFPYAYHSIAFISVAWLLNGFLPEIDNQVVFLEQMVNTFYAEFSDDKSLRIELDQKYRELKTEITGLLNNREYYRRLKLTKSSDLFKERTVSVLKAAVAFPAKRKNQLVADMVHMHLNRLFIDRPRNQELVVYYCLYKHRLSVRAMAKKSG